MSKSMRMMWGAVAVALLYGALCLVYYAGQDEILFHPETLPEDHVYGLTAPYEEVYLETEDGVRLHGLHARASGEASRGVVLHFHGNAENTADLSSRIELFTELGFDVIAPDYRGFGKSGGHMRGEKQFIGDAELWAGYAAREYRDRKFVVSGYSIGTGPAVQVAARSTPDLLLLEAPFTSIVELARAKAPFLPNALLLKYPLRSQRHIREVEATVVIFHGTEDNLIPDTHGRRLATAAGSNAEFVSVPGAGHNDAGASALYREVVSARLAALSPSR